MKPDVKEKRCHGFPLLGRPCRTADLTDFAACLYAWLSHMVDGAPPVPPSLARKMASGRLMQATSVPDWGFVGYVAAEMQRRGGSLRRWQEVQVTNALDRFMAKTPSSAGHQSLPGLPDRALARAWMITAQTADLSLSPDEDRQCWRAALRLLDYTANNARRRAVRRLTGHFIVDRLEAGQGTGQQAAEYAAEVFTSKIAAVKNALIDAWPRFKLMHPAQVASFAAVGGKTIARIMLGLLRNHDGYALALEGETVRAYKVAEMMDAGVLPDLSCESGELLAQAMERIESRASDPIVSAACARLSAVRLSAQVAACPPVSGARRCQQQGM